MYSAEVKVFILFVIVALIGYYAGTITKVESLLCIISMTLIYILLVLCRIKSNIEKHK